MNRQQMQKKLENFGYVFKGERILAGYSKRIKNFSCLGKHFHCNWDEKERVIGHHYTPITPVEARRLATVLDPVTDESYVGIAWVVFPWEMYEKEAVSAVKVINATEFGAKKREELEYADDFEEIVTKRAVEKKAEAERTSEEAYNGSDDGLELGNIPTSDQVDATIETHTEPEPEVDPLADMTTDGSGDQGGAEGEPEAEPETPKQISLERAELMSKTVPQLRADAKDLGLVGFQNLRKEELIEVILG
ncbi:MAG: Rho termination factor N-terminal domain-containing protein [Nitrosomonadaceae bacterium]